jgi:hypothetical protein
MSALTVFDGSSERRRRTVECDGGASFTEYRCPRFAWAAQVEALPVPRARSRCKRPARFGDAFVGEEVAPRFRVGRCQQNVRLSQLVPSPEM